MSSPKPGKRNLWPRDSDLDIFVHSCLDLSDTGKTLDLNCHNLSLSTRAPLIAQLIYYLETKQKTPYNSHYPHPQNTAPRKSSLYSQHFACSLQRPCTQIHRHKRHCQEERGLFKGIKYFSSVQAWVTRGYKVHLLTLQRDLSARYMYMQGEGSRNRG